MKNKIDEFIKSFNKQTDPVSFIQPIEINNPKTQIIDKKQKCQ